MVSNIICALLLLIVPCITFASEQPSQTQEKRVWTSFGCEKLNQQEAVAREARMAELVRNDRVAEVVNGIKKAMNKRACGECICETCIIMVAISSVSQDPNSKL